VQKAQLGHVTGEAFLCLRSCRAIGIVCQPTMLNGAAAYRLKMPIAFDRLLTTIVPGLQVGYTSPTGFEPVFWP
jgi:hypothetical protein